MATEQDLILLRGDTKTFKVTITSNGTPVDISSDLLFFTIKEINDNTEDDTSALITKRVVIPAGAEAIAGVAYITLTNADMDIIVGKYVYDIQWVDPTTTPETVNTLLYGKCTVKRDVTKATT